MFGLQRLGPAIRWLKGAWSLLLAVALGLFVVAVPVRFQELRAAAVAAQPELARLFAGRPAAVLDGLLSPGVYPFVIVGLEVAFVAAFGLVSAGISWGKTHDWRALYFSAVFVTYPVWVTPTLDALVLSGPAAVVADVVQATGLLFAINFFLLFPDGRFVPRWTVVTSIAWTAYTLAWGLVPRAWFSLIDPFVVTAPPFVALMIGWLTGLIAQAIRFRREADPFQRLQTKVVLLAITAAVLGYGAVYVTGRLLPDTGAPGLLYDLLGVPTFWLLALPMPVAFCVAMWRHHLFDFQAVVNRTLVYASLSAALGAVYLGLVFLLGELSRTFVGASASEELVVVVSTLTVAGLFSPFRQRIQSLVDRSFYRARYDAQQTVERFALGLRTHVELAVLNADLVRIVRDTFQPRHVSLVQIATTEGDLSRADAERRFNEQLAAASAREVDSTPRSTALGRARRTISDDRSMPVSPALGKQHAERAGPTPMAASAPR